MISGYLGDGDTFDQAIATFAKAYADQSESEALSDYAQLCGRTLARAHARSGTPALISGYLGNGDTFDQAIATFATTYADQNERDHEVLMKAARAGKIEVAVEPE